MALRATRNKTGFMRGIAHLIDAATGEVLALTPSPQWEHAGGYDSESSWLETMVDGTSVTERAFFSLSSASLGTTLLRRHRRSSWPTRRL